MPSPFTQVYDRLWAILDASSDLSLLVRPANRLRSINSAARPAKAHLLPADLPQLAILPASGEIHLFQTSTTSAFSQEFLIRCRAGDRASDPRLLDIKWTIIRAFAAQSDTLSLTAITGVEKARIQSSRYSFTSSDDPIPWIDVLTIEVFFRFPTASLA